jgi:hypothetical protein
MAKGAGESAEKVVKDIRRKTRRGFSAEEKIRIVLEGLRGVGEHRDPVPSQLTIRVDCRWKKKEPFRFVLRRALPRERFPYHRLVAEQAE